MASELSGAAAAATLMEKLEAEQEEDDDDEDYVGDEDEDSDDDDEDYVGDEDEDSDEEDEEVEEVEDKNEAAFIASAPFSEPLSMVPTTVEGPHSAYIAPSIDKPVVVPSTAVTPPSTEEASQSTGIIPLLVDSCVAMFVNAKGDIVDHQGEVNGSGSELFVEVYGFKLTSGDAELYRRLHNKYGHLLRDTVINASSTLLCNAVNEFLELVRFISSQWVFNVTPSDLVTWDKKLRMFERLGFNVAWLKECLAQIQDNVLHKGLLDAELAEAENLLMDKCEGLAIAREEVSLLQARLEEAERSVSILEQEKKEALQVLTGVKLKINVHKRFTTNSQLETMFR